MQKLAGDTSGGTELIWKSHINLFKVVDLTTHWIGWHSSKLGLLLCDGNSIMESWLHLQYKFILLNLWWHWFLSSALIWDDMHAFYATLILFHFNFLHIHVHGDTLTSCTYIEVWPTLSLHAIWLFANYNLVYFISTVFSEFWQDVGLALSASCAIWEIATWSWNFRKLCNLRNSSLVLQFPQVVQSARIWEIATCSCNFRKLCNLRNSNLLLYML